MSSIYLITNSQQVFVYPVGSGLVLPGSPEDQPPNFKWISLKEAQPLGPKGWLWNGKEKVHYYNCPISDNQASLLSVFLTPVAFEEAWQKADPNLKTALQLVIDNDFLLSFENDIELFVLDRINANGGLSGLSIEEELGIDTKQLRRGLLNLESRGLICNWSRQNLYKLTALGESTLQQYGWTPTNTSQTFPVTLELPVDTKLKPKTRQRNPRTSSAENLKIQEKDFLKEILPLFAQGYTPVFGGPKDPIAKKAMQSLKIRTKTNFDYKLSTMAKWKIIPSPFTDSEQLDAKIYNGKCTYQNVLSELQKSFADGKNITNATVAASQTLKIPKLYCLMFYNLFVGADLLGSK